MKKSVKKLLYWSPRTICVLFAVFMSYYVLMAINQGGTLWDTTLTLLADFIPVALFVFILVFIWRWEWLAILFVVSAPAFLIWKLDILPSSSFLITSVILFLAGLLFLADWFSTRNLEKNN